MSSQGSAQDRGSASLPPSLETTDSQHDKAWGHFFVSQPPSDVFRIGLLNPGGIPIDLTNAKSKILRQFITKVKVDAIGLIETNINWKYATVSQRRPKRTRGWWENLHLNSACYEDYKNPHPSQPGGVSLWSINKGAHRVMEQGRDLCQPAPPRICSLDPRKPFPLDSLPLERNIDPELYACSYPEWHAKTRGCPH